MSIIKVHLTFGGQSPQTVHDIVKNKYLPGGCLSVEYKHDRA